MAERKFRIEIDPATLVPRAGVRRFYWWSVAVIAGSIGLLLIGWRYLPNVVPLLFTEPWGEGRLVPKLYLWLLPLMASVITITNVILGKAIPKEYLALGYTLGVGALMISLMQAISLYGIVQSLL